MPTGNKLSLSLLHNLRLYQSLFITPFRVQTDVELNYLDELDLLKMFVCVHQMSGPNFSFLDKDKISVEAKTRGELEAALAKNQVQLSLSIDAVGYIV